jgi:hypothetical protein
MCSTEKLIQNALFVLCIYNPLEGRSINKMHKFLQCIFFCSGVPYFLCEIIGYCGNCGVQSHDGSDAVPVKMRI